MKGEKTIVLYGSPQTNADIYWRTGFWSSSNVLLVDVPGEKVYLFVSRMEYDSAVEVCGPDVMVHPVQQFSHVCATVEPMLRRRGAKNIVTTYASLQNPFVEKLRVEGYSVEFEDIAYTNRKKKTSEEVEYIKANQEAVRLAMISVVSTLTEAQIVDNRVVYYDTTLTTGYLRSRIGAYLAQKEIAMPADCMVDIGIDTYRPHGSRVDVPIVPHQPIIVDIFPRSLDNHYWADMTRSFVKGRATAQYSRMHRVVEAGFHMALDLMAPGTNFLDVYWQVTEFFEGHGYAKNRTRTVNEGFVHGLGHRIGLDIHEKPTFNEDPVLREGDVLTVEPGLYYPDIGGVRIEDTIVITESGYEQLASYPTQLLEL